MVHLDRLRGNGLQVAVAVEILLHNLAVHVLVDLAVAAMAHQQELLQLQEQ
jgi:hypothetical protein